MSKKALSVLIVVILAAVSLLVFNWPEKANGQLDDFAKCLAAKGATMYGNYNCPHCQNEKGAFGSSFKYVPYVECTQNPQECVSQNIDYVPTWIFLDGRKFSGEQGLEKLSEESGCSLPQAKS